MSEQGISQAIGDNVKILAVDDEPEIVDIVCQYLGAHGFEVVGAHSAEAARDILKEQDVDLVILDVNLPGEDGVSLARSIRQDGGPSVLMLTAVAGVDDRIRGLSSGADDYVVKPFEPRELLARVRSLVRRLPPRSSDEDEARDDDSTRVPFGRWTLDLKAQTLTGAQGQDLQLTAMEFDLLKAFAEHPNRVLNRDQLAEFAHHREWSPDDRSIDIRIARLRRKIEDDPAEPKLLVTVRGLGYKFVADAEG